MSKIVYPMLDMYSHLRVDGFGKIGIDFCAILNCKELVAQNNKSVMVDRTIPN